MVSSVVMHQKGLCDSWDKKNMDGWINNVDSLGGNENTTMCSEKHARLFSATYQHCVK